MNPTTKKIVVGGGIVLGIVVAIFLMQQFLLPAGVQPGTTPDPIRGGTTPVVTIKEYSDFQCPACEQMVVLLERAADEFGDSIQLQYNDYPLTQIHPNGFAAAEAAQCAWQQDRFWQYHDVLFEQQDIWSIERDPTATFVIYAEQLALDTTQFESCITNHEQRAAVQEDVVEGKDAKVSSTPTLFINDERYVGVGSYDNLRTAIQKYLE
ncbi:MAG: thioredoxin domain-containing protein [Candidatus Kerfeldbacteria bacterium]|nr:thioredoxin domain-containing protein [Candidatus Kerfeldbacteria bacterium]